MSQQTAAATTAFAGAGTAALAFTGSSDAGGGGERPGCQPARDRSTRVAVSGRTGGAIPPVPHPLSCKACGAHFAAEPLAICAHCLGPLEPVYDAQRTLPGRDEIARRPPSLWRYAEWLPYDGAPLHSPDSGFTPLLEAPALAARLGVASAWIKNDAVSHPSLSFKDRVVSSAINAAAGFHLDTIGCASTGNLANAVAAHAARAGLTAWIFIPADLEPGKIIGTGRVCASPGAGARYLRRCEPAVRTGCRPLRLGHRECESAQLLRRRLEDDGVRDRRTVRLAIPECRGSTHGRRLTGHETRERLRRGARRCTRGRRAAAPLRRTGGRLRTDRARGRERRRAAYSPSFQPRLRARSLSGIPRMHPPPFAPFARAAAGRPP